VYEVMALLRRQHWPLSLLYGLYGHPMLRVDGGALSVSTPLALQTNFSQSNVGSREMMARR
jgi:hypothetical protein